jgi:hypothetical protein
LFGAEPLETALALLTVEPRLLGSPAALTEPQPEHDPGEGEDRCHNGGSHGHERQRWG